MYHWRWASTHLCRDFIKHQRIVIYHTNYVESVFIINFMLSSLKKKCFLWKKRTFISSFLFLSDPKLLNGSVDPVSKKCIVKTLQYTTPIMHYCVQKKYKHTWYKWHIPICTHTHSHIHAYVYRHTNDLRYQSVCVASGWSAPASHGPKPFSCYREPDVPPPRGRETARWRWWMEESARAFPCLWGFVPPLSSPLERSVLHAYEIWQRRCRFQLRREKHAEWTTNRTSRTSHLPQQGLDVHVVHL